MTSRRCPRTSCQEAESLQRSLHGAVAGFLLQLPMEPKPVHDNNWRAMKPHVRRKRHTAPLASAHNRFGKPRCLSWQPWRPICDLCVGAAPLAFRARQSCLRRACSLSFRRFADGHNGRNPPRESRYSLWGWADALRSPRDRSPQTGFYASADASRP